MAKYSFSSTERYAVFVVHSEKCYMCKQPIDLKSMQVDHVIPESLLENPEILNDVLKAFGLSNDFNLNSFENWMPACVPCNLRKLSTVFHPSPLIQLEIQKAIDKANDARTFANDITSKRKVFKALGTIMSAMEQEKFTDDILKTIEPLMELHRQRRNSVQSNEPIKLTPLFTVISKNKGILTIKGPYGIGSRPVGEDVDESFNCPNCGNIGAWNGARCVICGHLIDD